MTPTKPDSKIDALLDRVPVLGRLNRWCNAHPWLAILIAIAIGMVIAWKQLAVIYHYIHGL